MENITTRAHTHPTYIPLHLNYEKMKVTLVCFVFVFGDYVFKKKEKKDIHSYSCVERRFVMSVSIFII